MVSEVRGWDDYVERFHAGRAGVTEELLGRSVDDAGRTAYEWICEGLPDGLVIDLGCGSGPGRSMVDRWVGIDRSPAELDVARRAGRGPLVRASAQALPIRSAAAAGAMAAMSLMVIADPAAALAELARALRPGGVLQVLLPVDRPLGAVDVARYGALLALLGRRSMPFPRPDAAAAPGPLLEAAGFDVVKDERRSFRFPLDGHAAADLLLDSLYLPGVGPRRIALARMTLRATARGDIGIPLRRVTARLAR